MWAFDQLKDWPCYSPVALMKPGDRGLFDPHQANFSPATGYRFLFIPDSTSMASSLEEYPISISTSLQMPPWSPRWL